MDPELCPKCSKEMKRSKTLMDQHELQRLLKNLGIAPQGFSHFCFVSSVSFESQVS